ncbi:aldehyde dehydrogenase [Trichoderma citrinoviride]|uniref:Aldehyde dehydrogenase n=1 Tax=Trichoderma citrinoviride TaxID=58853 RepID=A0A2T4B1R4_9HYPO|nr:aldehyde dehydrogenase [Trichoderma citrinoviride]PTB63254.1 aldehyde dehydrogenase [Trichoderma citrinoviride]
MALQSEYQSLNPATGEHIETFPELTDEELRSALSVAHDCFTNHWRSTPMSERAKLIRDELAQLITLEVGKLIAESRFEVQFCIATFEYFAVNAEKLLQPITVASDPGSEIWTEPLGVILAIEPWNFPLLQLSRVAAPHIMAGNVLMAKPAPTVPQTSLAFAKLFSDAGVPKGVYTNIFATVPQIHYLVEDFRVRGVTLTGSERAGAAVAENAGRHLKKTVLELGGSDPLIVLPDSSIEDAVSVAVAGRMFNTGQGCAASKRVIVVGRDREREVIEGMRKAMAELKPGDPLDPKTTLGAIFSKRGLDGLLAQIERAKAAGATIVLGGKRFECSGFYLEPTIMTNISPGNPIAQEETFGPIAAIYGVDTEEEAIQLANNTAFGLGASIIGTSVSHAKKIAAQLEAGMVFINGPAYSSPDLPFGGIKNSGFGRELSEIGFSEFTNKKLVRVASST